MVKLTREELIYIKFDVSINTDKYNEGFCEIYVPALDDILLDRQEDLWEKLRVVCKYEKDFKKCSRNFSGLSECEYEKCPLIRT